MPKPYDPITDVSATRDLRTWGVFSYATIYMIAIMLGAFTFVPAAVLLNQDWQIVPTNVYATGIELNGMLSSNQEVTRLSIGVSLIFLATSCACAG